MTFIKNFTAKLYPQWNSSDDNWTLETRERDFSSKADLGDFRSRNKSLVMCVKLDRIIVNEGKKFQDFTKDYQPECLEFYTNFIILYKG